MCIIVYLLLFIFSARPRDFFNTHISSLKGNKEVVLIMLALELSNCKHHENLDTYFCVPMIEKPSKRRHVLLRKVESAKEREGRD